MVTVMVEFTLGILVVEYTRPPFISKCLTMEVELSFLCEGVVMLVKSPFMNDDKPGLHTAKLHVELHDVKYS